MRLIDEALSFVEEVVWAVDQPGGGAALLLALLWERDQKVLYVPGLPVHRARETYRGESKTDARDARVISDHSRMRSDLGELKPGEQEISELQLLLARRRDLITDQSRTITRPRETLVSLFPALERALDLNSKGPLILLMTGPHSLVLYLIRAPRLPQVGKKERCLVILEKVEETSREHSRNVGVPAKSH